MFLSVKDKEKYVLEYYEQDKTYREIVHLLHISPRDISTTLKRAREKKEQEEKRRLSISNTSKALKLYKKGKNPIDVAIILDISPQEAEAIYLNYLSLQGLNHLIQIYQKFDRNKLEAFFRLFYKIEDSNISENEIVEGLKMINNLPSIKKEYNEKSGELITLQRKRDYFIDENNKLTNHNFRLNYRSNLLVCQIKSKEETRGSLDNEINTKRKLLDSINNSEEWDNLENKIKEQINEFLTNKKVILRLSVISILKVMREDPEKENLIYNMLDPVENPNSERYLISYEKNWRNDTHFI